MKWSLLSLTVFFVALLTGLPQEAAAQQNELASPKTVKSGVAEEIAKIKEQWPPTDPASRDFYRHFRIAKAHYQKTLPSLFGNDIWPKLVASRAEELLAEERRKHDYQRSRHKISNSPKHPRKSTTKDPRSPAHEDYVPSELGARYRWVSGKWMAVPTEAGFKKVSLKKE